MVLTGRGDTLAIGIAFPVLGTILVALRFYLRRHRGIPLQLDDWFCLPAWVRCVSGSPHLHIGD